MERTLVQLRAARLSNDLHSWPRGTMGAVRRHRGKTLPPGNQERRAPCRHTAERGPAPSCSRTTGSQACCHDPCPRYLGPGPALLWLIKGLCLGLASQGAPDLHAAWSSPGLHAAANYFAMKAPLPDEASRESLRLPAQGRQKPRYRGSSGPRCHCLPF